MKHANRIKLVLAATLALGIGIGCASAPPNVVAIDRSANLPAEIAKTRQEFGQDVQQQVQQLSPTYAKRAERSLNKAEENMRDNDMDDAYRHLEESRAWLAQARAVAKTSRVEFAEAMKAREAALAVPGDNKEIDKVDKDLAKLAERVEDQKSVSGTDKQEIVEKYVEVQRKRLKVAHLDPIEQRLDQAEDLGAKRLAPRTYERATNDYKAALTVLEVTPLRQEEFMQRAQTANRSSADAINVVRQTADASNRTTEEIVLSRMQSENQANRNYQSAMEERNRLSVEVAGLQQKAQPQQLLEKLQAELPAEKAEIAMSPDGQVMIRLKDLQFKSNSSDLAPSAAVVISQVKDALSDINPKKLVIVGHTDATGSKKVNETLSKERAESVAEVLKNDEVLRSAEIDTIGHGAAKPLSNNRTREGRAENRRVEILIESI